MKENRNGRHSKEYIPAKKSRWEICDRFVWWNLFKKTDKVIADGVIGEYDIDIPLLEKNEEFFLADIMQIVVIKKRLRSSDGSITYYVEDEIVETEDQKKKLEEMYDELLREFRDYKREYKYKNKFFNSGSDKAPNDKNRWI